MSKNILIVESDSSLSNAMRGTLEQRGLSVEVTADGKGSIELIRKRRPNLVLLGVELSHGQNGYILCGKLKKDDDLKTTPIVIVGSQDGFAQHRKLKTRADEYLAKPVDMGGLLEKVGGLIGLPEVTVNEVVEEDGIGFSDLVEEVSVEAVDGASVRGDAELDMLDQAFDNMSPESTALSGGAHSELGDPFDGLDVSEAPVAPAPRSAFDEDIATGEHTVIGMPDGFGAAAQASAATPFQRAVPAPSAADAAELRGLRAKVLELEGSLKEAQARAQEAQGRARDLEDELSAKAAALESAKSAGGKADNKEVFALREAANKKEKDILRLKSELNEKDQEIVEVKDRVIHLEQQVSERDDELAKRETQIKALTQRSDQLSGERKRLEGQLATVREEARAASADLASAAAQLEQTQGQLASTSAELEQTQEQLATTSAELEQTQGQLATTSSDLNDARGRIKQLESALAHSRETARGLQQQVDETRHELGQARDEIEGLRAELEQSRSESDSLRTQLAEQTNAFADEAAALRQRISELEETVHKHEERIAKFYGKIKDDEKKREKTRKSLAIALQLLEEQPSIEDEIDENAA
jgi:DNA-binding response OmpR family regulator/predicted  nucleic acid-binding Zn-ribbon protein